MRLGLDGLGFHVDKTLFYGVLCRQAVFKPSSIATRKRIVCCQNSNNRNGLK
ncbi:MAG: hypothetical protein LBE33_03485 [Zoogloeaceae bacterium]|jgi:hypothetical protein|nr:hypothetical protein [Zoogloeaceae bacterium]